MSTHIEIIASDPATAASVAVRLASVDAYDAPVAFRVRDTEGALGRPEVAEVRSHGGALWRRYGARYGHAALSGERGIADACMDPDRHDNPFGTGPDVPPADRAGQLLVVDGELWESVREPVAVLCHDPEGGMPHLAFRWDGGTDPVDTYRIDQVELAASCSAHPVHVPFVQVLMPECVRHDATAALLAKAAREVADGLRDLAPGAASDPRPARIAGASGPVTLEGLLSASERLGERPPALAAAAMRASLEPLPDDAWDGPEPTGVSPG